MSEQPNITASALPDDRSKDLITDNELNNSVRQPIPPPPQQEPVSGSVARQNNAVTEEPQPLVTSAPPLPRFDYSPQAGSSNDDMMQTMRNVATDIIKNITIDGVSPQVSGSNIQFNTQNNQSASSQWAQQNQPPPVFNTGTAAQNPNPDMGSLMSGPKAMAQAAAERQAEQKADDAKWGWGMSSPTSSKQVAAERQAEQKADDAEWGWSNTGPTATKGKLQREEAKEDAAEYDIDTRGMSTRQIKKAVAEAKEEDDTEQSEFDSRFERFVSSLKGKSDDKKEDKDDNKKDDNKGNQQRDREEIRNNTKESSVPRQKDTVEVLPVWLTSANQEKRRVAYVVTASNHDIAKGSPPDTLEEDETELTFAAHEYYLCDGAPHPFKVSLSTENNSTKYKVFLRSSITNGVNGDAFSITGLNEDKTFETGYIVAEASVTSSPFEISGSFEIKVVTDSTDAKEVKLENGKQTKIRLFIAKLTGTSGGEGDDAPKVFHAITTSFRTAVALNNGVPVYILQAAPTHPDKI